jgi:hypothetical protein
MTKIRNLVKGLVATLMMVGIVACTVSSDPDSGPPQDLVAKNDHAGLEKWYAKEAAHLRKRKKDMMAMVEQYKKLQSRPGSAPAKILLIEHCQTLAADYDKAADDADTMARGSSRDDGQLIRESI